MESTNKWPSGRGTQSSIIAQFGNDRAAFLQEMLNTGDPLADAVVEAIKTEGGHIRTQLSQGLKEGLASLENPHIAVKALLTSTEQLPDFVDKDLIATGARSWYSVPFPLHLISLTAGALVKVYASTSIARVLATTGRLVEGAEKRVNETGLWLAKTMLPDGLQTGNPGYVATVQVRMLHAMMRPYVRTHGYDENVDGAAISQIDLARTWIDFTYTSMHAETVMGGEFTNSEIAEMYRYWWHIGHLLGIDARFYNGIKSHQEALKISEMLDAVTGLPVPQTSELVKSTMGAVSAAIKQIFPIPNQMSAAVQETLARMFHGDALADELKIKSHPEIKMLLQPFFSAMKARRSRRRANETKWNEGIDKEIRDNTERIALGEKEGSAFEAEAKGQLNEHDRK